MHGRTSEAQPAQYDDGSAANDAVLMPFSVDSPVANDMRRLERLVWIVIVIFILVGAVLLPFRVFGAAWGLYRGSCDGFHGHDPQAAHSTSSDSDPESRSSKRRVQRPVRTHSSSSVSSSWAERRGDRHSGYSSREYRALSVPDTSPVRP